MLAGRVGLVNEPCGTYREHGGTQTSALNVETRLRDLERLRDAIVDTAQEKVPDAAERRKIALEADRYLTRHAIGYIASRRRNGASLPEVLPIIWQWRHHFARPGARNLMALPRPLALLLLPRRLTRWLRQLLRFLNLSAPLTSPD
jgi:hypothetical protein